MPQIYFDSLEQVPADFKSIVKTADDGKISINVVSKQALDEFRDNNINLKRDHDAALAQLNPLKEIVGEDPAAFKKAYDDLLLTGQRVKDGELKETRQIEEALGKRTDEMRKDYERQLQVKMNDAQAWREKFQGLDSNYRREKIATAVTMAAMDPDSGVNPRAVSDLVNASFQVFQVDDNGKLVAKDGDAPIYGSSGTEYMTPKEWLVKMQEQKPFFFKSSNGGGAGGDGQQGNGKTILGVDPAALKKMTPQQRLALANDAAERASNRR